MPTRTLLKRIAFIFSILSIYNSPIIIDSANLYEIAEDLIKTTTSNSGSKQIPEMCETWVFIWDSLQGGIEVVTLVKIPQVSIISKFDITNLHNNATKSFFNREIPTEDILNPFVFGVYRFIPNTVCSFIKSLSSHEFSFKTNELLTNKIVRPHNDYFIIFTPNNEILEETTSSKIFQDLRFKYIIISKNKHHTTTNISSVLNFCSSNINPVHEINFRTRSCPSLLNGKHFHVTSVASPSLVRYNYNEDGTVNSGGGVFYEIFKTASLQYNFTFHGQYGGFGGASGFKKDGVWRGAVGEVFSRERIFGIGAAVTEERHHVIDPSVTVSVVSRVFYVRKPSFQNEDWRTILWPFDLYSWIAFISTCIIIVPIYYGTKLYYKLNPHRKQLKDILSHVIMDLLQIILEQDISLKKWKGCPNKFLIVTWIFFSLIIGAAYTGDLVSFLTSLELEEVPRNHAELSSSNYDLFFRYYGGTTYLATLNSSDPIHQYIIKKSLLVNSSEDCIIRAILNKLTACLDYESSGQFAIATNGTLNAFQNENNNALVRSVDTDYSFNVVWIFRKYSPLTETFNQILLWNLASGLYEYWVHQDRVKSRISGAQWLKSQNGSKIKEEIELMQEGDFNGPISMNISSLFVPFIIIMMGNGLASLVFVIEILRMVKTNSGRLSECGNVRILLILKSQVRNCYNTISHLIYCLNTSLLSCRMKCSQSMIFILPVLRKKLCNKLFRSRR